MVPLSIVATVPVCPALLARMRPIVGQSTMANDNAIARAFIEGCWRAGQLSSVHWLNDFNNLLLSYYYCLTCMSHHLTSGPPPARPCPPRPALPHSRIASDLARVSSLECATEPNQLTTLFSLSLSCSYGSSAERHQDRSSSPYPAPPEKQPWRRHGRGWLMRWSACGLFFCFFICIQNKNLFCFI